jgi:hypothetical protein
VCILTQPILAARHLIPTERSAFPGHHKTAQARVPVPIRRRLDASNAVS